MLYFTGKGLQAQHVKSGDAEVLSFGLRVLKRQSSFERALNIWPVPFPILEILFLNPLCALQPGVTESVALGL